MSMTPDNSSKSQFDSLRLDVSLQKFPKSLFQGIASVTGGAGPISDFARMRVVLGAFPAWKHAYQRTGANMGTRIAARPEMDRPSGTGRREHLLVSRQVGDSVYVTASVGL